MIFLTFSASLRSLRPQQCSTEDVLCTHSSLGQAAFLFFALYVIDVGAGGVQATVTSFGADQFDEEDSKEKTQKTSFFNWFYQSTILGGLLAATFFVYIQDNVSWGLGFGASLIAVIIGTISFIAGTPFYRHHPPGGNPLTRIGQVIVASARKWHHKIPVGSELYEVREVTNSVIQGGRKIRHTKEFRYGWQSIRVLDSLLPKSSSILIFFSQQGPQWLEFMMALFFDVCDTFFSFSVLITCARFLDKAAVEMQGDRINESHVDPWRLCTITQVEEVI